MFVLLESIAFHPIYRQFVIGLVIISTMMCLQWIIELSVVIPTLLGYELDKTMTVQKSEKSVLTIMSPKTKKTVSDESFEVTNKVADNMTPGLAASLARFRKMKNACELEGEIKRIRDTVTKSTIELGFLENMLFALSEEESTDSKSSSGKKGHNGGEESGEGSKGLRVEEMDRPQAYLAVGGLVREGHFNDLGEV